LIQYWGVWSHHSLKCNRLQQKLRLSIFCRCLVRAVTSMTSAESDRNRTITLPEASISTSPQRWMRRAYSPVTSPRYPEDHPLPALLWMHGGVFILGNVAGDDAYCQQLCQQADCLIVSVEYRLAPNTLTPPPWMIAIRHCYGWLNLPKNCPLAFVSFAELCLLRDEALGYGQRLMQSGVRTELHTYPGNFHGWHNFAPQFSATIRHQSDIISA